MKSYDFEYDGLNLSDFGFMICSFDSKGVETISNGSTITFNTVSMFNGNKSEMFHNNMYLVAFGAWRNGWHNGF